MDSLVQDIYEYVQIGFKIILPIAIVIILYNVKELLGSINERVKAKKRLLDTVNRLKEIEIDEMKKRTKKEEK